jgi:uncharacterized protein (TIGR02466 family)
MNLIEIPIFATYYSYDYLPLDNDKIESYCRSLKFYKAGYKKSNGWQSEYVDINDDNISQLISLIRLRLLKVSETFKINNNYRLSLKNAWFNIYEPGNSYLNSTPPHLHKGCFMSGIYYIKCSEKSSKLTMISPNIVQEHSMPSDAVIESNIWNSSRWVTTPEPGKIIFFPSWQLHYVDEYSEDERISFAFNAVLEKI